jgi:hypothetical protein
MNQSDPASLANLNDIVVPAAVGWWPLASGWYVVAGIVAVLLAWFVARSARQWKASAYRRAALLELQSLIDNSRDSLGRSSSLRQLPSLLKRTALSVYPRENVAGLSGENWFNFLNAKVAEPSFTESTFETLNRIAYTTGDLVDIHDDAVEAVFNACRSWIESHSAEAASGKAERP